MTTQQIQALREICTAIIDTVKEAPHGAPGGSIYAALMSQGCTFDQFSQIMSGIVKAGKLRKEGDLYFAV